MQNKMEIANAIFDSIDVIVNKKLEKLAFDRTVVAKVISDINNDGSYLVEYQNSKFYAHPIGAVEYAQNDMVYVVIPSNNMRRLKFIFGKIGNEAPTVTINMLQYQQQILIEALQMSFDGDIDGAKQKLLEIGGDN